MLLTEVNGSASVELVPLQGLGEWLLLENQFEARPLRDPLTRSDVWTLRALVRLEGSEQVFEREDRFAVEQWLTFAGQLGEGAARPAELFADSDQFQLRVVRTGRGDTVEVEVAFEGVRSLFYTSVAIAAGAGASMRSVWAGWRRA